jgi:very-short-patch-repair endonuclease
VRRRPGTSFYSGHARRCASAIGRSPAGGKAVFDAAYPELLLGLEADGDASHKGLLDRMRDEARDEKCGLVGWDVRRYSTEDIRERPAGIADEVARLLREAEAA